MSGSAHTDDDASVDEWQIRGIRQAIASLDRGEGISHQQVKDWVLSWGSQDERPMPKGSRSLQSQQRSHC